MGPHINKRVLGYFKSSAKNLVEGKAIAVRCCKRKFKCGGLDLDAHHRALRIMTKHGYMQAKEVGSDIDYTMTPKGIALYDSLTIYLEQP